MYFLRELTQINEFRQRKFDLALKRCFHRMDEMIEDKVDMPLPLPIPCPLHSLTLILLYFKEYEYQLQQFRKIPNPSDRKPSTTAEEPEPQMDLEGSLSPPKPASKKIPLSEAMALFQKLLTQQKEVILLIL